MSNIKTVKAVRPEAEWYVIDRGNGHGAVVRLDRSTGEVTGLAYSGKFEPTEEQRDHLGMSLEAYMDIRDAITRGEAPPPFSLPFSTGL